MTVRIAVFAMSDPNHFASPLLVATALAKAGADVCFWTDVRFARRVRDAGLQFADIFANGPLDSVDDSSRPAPARFVTYAGVHADRVVAEVGEFAPDLVVFDVFAVIARVVAKALDIPAIPVVSAHCVYGPDMRALISGGARVSIDPRCIAAADRLRRDFGIADASPFSYIPDPSPLLNIQMEPREWYTPAENKKLGPLAFFGSVADRPFKLPRSSKGRLKVFASFGTVIWRYWTREGMGAFAAIADAIQAIGGEGTISLGGAPVREDEVASLRRSSVKVEPYVNQWECLRESDLFITHHGRGSTHEGVACGTPMLSYPFFWDQPGLAVRAEEFGIAKPLFSGASGQDGKLTASDVVTAIEDTLANLDRINEALERAQQWERSAIEERPAVVEAILSHAK